MRTFIHRILLKEPTVLSWTAVLLVLGALVYGVFIYLAMRENLEAMMGLLVYPYFLMAIILVLLTDYYMRRYIRLRLLWVSMLQLLLVIPAAYGLWNRLFYRTILYTEADVKWIMVVETGVRQPMSKRDFLLQKTTLRVPADGVVLTDHFRRGNQSDNLIIRGYRSNLQKPVIQYWKGAYDPPLRCRERTYDTWIILLEDQPNRMSPVTDTVLNKLYAIACRKLHSSVKQ